MKNIKQSPRVVIVGPCASGKSTLAARLKEDGFDVHVSGQEHSGVRDLWATLDPDVLIALDVDLDTIRQRRSPYWSEYIYRAQRERLKSAFDSADLVIDTTTHDAEDVYRQVADNLGHQHEAQTDDQDSSTPT